MRRGLSAFNMTSLALGLAFLYLPIAILVIYSFNASRLVTVWGGWSLRWYAALIEDRAMLEAAAASFAVAAASAAAATVLGTMAALALARLGRFRGRLAFSAMIYAPLVMPEVITGLSLLLLFVALEVDLGFWTITIGHTTLTVGFVTVVVQARLLGFDRSLEEAAMDLGCPPVRTFLTVTLPLSLPGVVAGVTTAFAWTFSAFATPQLIGGGRVNMVSNLVYQLGFASFNFPFAASLCVAGLALTIVVLSMLRLATRPLETLGTH